MPKILRRNWGILMDLAGMITGTGILVYIAWETGVLYGRPNQYWPGFALVAGALVVCAVIDFIRRRRFARQLPTS